ncbi:hypothetical protein RRG08_043653 [Elysia crispata]|uniref:Uncharacterized protein n=1 Tax=Elysia crispata TaxID=231223 RepID=A0AAE0ZVA0_9GAST|nr:hypothetical protein RRG08_043653 [Elysia crispata]
MITSNCNCGLVSSSGLLAAVSSARHSLSYSASHKFGTARGDIFGPPQPVLLGVAPVRDCSRRYLRPATACPTRRHTSSGLLAAISSARHSLSYSASHQFGTARGDIFGLPQPVLPGVAPVRDCSRRYLRPATACPTWRRTSSGLLAAISSARHSLSYWASHQFGTASGGIFGSPQPVLLGVAPVRGCKRRYLRLATACPIRRRTSSGLLAAVSSARHSLSYSASHQFGTASGGIFGSPQPVLLGVAPVRDCSRRYLRLATACPTQRRSSSGLLAAAPGAHNNHRWELLGSPFI